jgi:hypothetical protein
MIEFVLVDALIVLIGIITISRSFFNNQRRQLLIVLSIAAGLFVPYTLVVNNLFNSFNIVLRLSEFLGFPQAYSLLGSSFTTEAMKGFYLFALLMIYGLLVFLTIFFLTRIIVYLDEIRYQRFSSYAIVHRPYVGVPLGIIKAFLYIYIYLIALSFLAPITGFDLQANSIMVTFNNLDSYVEYINNAAQQIRAPFI